MAAQVKISITIMAHPSRALYAEMLLARVSKMPFYAVSLVYDTNDSEWDNGVAALRSHVGSDWHVVIQDDAIISNCFYDNVARAIAAVPMKTLISLYTGTVRPEQARVCDALAAAKRHSASWLRSNSLYWGVGIALPTAAIEPMLRFVSDSILPYDRRVGSYFGSNGIPVYYTVPSLVDHDYQLPSLVNNDRNGLKRQAHNYCASNAVFNGRTVRIV